jgi:hypothetical protein
LLKNKIQPCEYVGKSPGINIPGLFDEQLYPKQLIRQYSWRSLQARGFLAVQEAGFNLLYRKSAVGRPGGHFSADYD